MSWITLKKGCYQLRPKQEKKTWCQMEIDVWDSAGMECHSSCEGKYSKLAPLRILSFDIECLPVDGKFPTPDKNPVIMIGNIVQVLGKGHEEPIIRNVFTLESCAQIVGTKVFTFKNEEDMLVAWREFVRLADPDVFTGYNI